MDSFPRFLALFLIRSYQLVLSPMLGGACRFYPTCSCYGSEAFKNHDSKTAFILTLKRVLKCRPLGPSGFDPVPDKLNEAQ
ncbi:MAG: membrane protein insertion efficiency factor YidD [Bdellovibrionota bacterium]